MVVVSPSSPSSCSQNQRRAEAWWMARAGAGKETVEVEHSSLVWLGLVWFGGGGGGDWERGRAQRQQQQQRQRGRSWVSPLGTGEGWGSSIAAVRAS